MLELPTSQRHKPDILDCLANLSNDEVFTPPALANKVLDLLPKEVWSNPTLRFLDPCCKSGVFLREAAKRLLVGLQHEFSDESALRDHIFRNMLFGIAITELTAQISRRSLYYSKDASSANSVVTLDSASGNISYVNTRHRYVRGTCSICGAPKQIEGDRVRDHHAYSLIHTGNPFSMKFDVIIGNPPYQLKTNGYGAQAKPIYHLFVQEALKLQPRYLSFIIPARWYAGGMGLDEFRKSMLSDRHLRVLVDHADASECFPGVEIKGGVCYFLWDKHHGNKNEDKCLVKNKVSDTQEIADYRRLDEYDVLIRSNHALSILRKVMTKDEPRVSSHVSGVQPFGLPTNFRDFKSTKFEGAVELFARGERGWVAPKVITVNQDWIKRWKVLTSRAYGAGETVPHQITGKPLVAGPNSACTMTYLVLGVFDHKRQAECFSAYARTRFFRFLVSLRKNTQDLSRDRFSFVPSLPMTKIWTDETLYDRYGLSTEERDFIASQIKEMPQ